jgi:hypothetical protein
VSRRLSLAELRELVLDELDDEWRSSTELGQRLGLDNGSGWYRLCLTLERLVVDGEADIKVLGRRARRFRRTPA